MNNHKDISYQRKYYAFIYDSLVPYSDHEVFKTHTVDQMCADYVRKCDANINSFHISASSEVRQ